MHDTIMIATSKTLDLQSNEHQLTSIDLMNVNTLQNFDADLEVPSPHHFNIEMARQNERFELQRRELNKNMGRMNSLGQITDTSRNLAFSHSHSPFTGNLSHLISDSPLTCRANGIDQHNILGGMSGATHSEQHSTIKSSILSPCLHQVGGIVQSEGISITEKHHNQANQQIPQSLSAQIQMAPQNMVPVNSSLVEPVQGSPRTSSINAYIGHLLFPNHHPFDFNSYPITNPPLYDSTMTLPYNDGHSRRRRISISNGQIGQIINHEAFFYDEMEIPIDDRYNKGISRYNDRAAVRTVADHTSTSFLQGSTYPSQPTFNSYQTQAVRDCVNLPHRSLESLQPSLQHIHQLVLQPAQKQPPFTFVDYQALPFGECDAPSKVGIVACTTTPSVNKVIKIENDDLIDAAGVPPPNHLLLYNNEVIYNPNDGPIPGTAAWKKQRLLERNRVAALKCRQRKKQVQIQMQQNVSMFEQEVEEKDKKLQQCEQVFRLYNKHLREFLASRPEEDALEPLKKYIDLDSIEQLSEEGK